MQSEKIVFELELSIFEKKTKYRNSFWGCEAVENYSLESGKWFGTNLDHSGSIRSNLRKIEKWCLELHFEANFAAKNAHGMVCLAVSKDIGTFSFAVIEFLVMTKQTFLTQWWLWYCLKKSIRTKNSKIPAGHKDETYSFYQYTKFKSDMRFE